MGQPVDFSPAGAIRGFVYRLLWRCAGVFFSAANGLLYFAAGLQRQRDLEAAGRALWRDFYTADDDVDLGLDRWEHRLYGEQLRSADRVLLIGSGTGRDLLALRKLGYDATGLEPVPELVAISRENLARRGVTAVVLSGPVQTADLGGTYDAMIFSPGVYSCLPRSAARVATLTRLKDHLSPDGRVLVSYLRFRRQSPLSRWMTRLGARLSRADWRPERGDVFCRDYVASRVLRYEHLFLPGEVATECQAAGLRVVRDQLESPPFHCAVAVR